MCGVNPSLNIFQSCLFISETTTKKSSNMTFKIVRMIILCNFITLITCYIGGKITI